MSWKCFFGHEWIYSDHTPFILNQKVRDRYYKIRTCDKCGCVEENTPTGITYKESNYFELRHIWRRIK